MDDLISRQAAIDALDGKIEITGRTKAVIITNYISLVKDRIEQLPSAQPERKKGRWLDRSAYCVCNLCGHTEQQFNGVEPIPRHTPFCATCGAEMEETE